MKYDLKDKVVIITGASSGIGKECALLLAQKGAKLVLVARSREGMEEVKKSYPDADILIVKADVTKKEEVDALVQDTVRHFKRVDILINNAGMGLRGSIISTPLEYFHKIIDVNLMGTLYCLRAVYPFMKEQGQGCIVNVSSVAGLKGFCDSGLYSATKFAVAGLTESLAMEAEVDHIRVLLVCPGKTETSFEENLAYNEKNTFSSREGVSSRVVAAALIKGIVHNKRLVVVGRGCQPLYYLNRVSPALTNLIIKYVY